MGTTPRWMRGTAFAVFATLSAASVQAQNPRAPGIEIVEPAAWGETAARSIEIVPRNSLRVTGFATAPSGIGKVLVGGLPATLSPEAEGRVRFTAYVRVEEETKAVEVVAYPMAGSPLSRTFGIAPVAAGGVAGGRSALDPGGPGLGGERWAVVVGVGAYRDPRIPALRYADADARAFHDFLVSEGAGLGGFARDHVRLLLNEEATVRNVRSALLTWLRGATDDDIVVIYFAGHGAPDPGRLDDHYLLTWDTDLDDLPATALLMDAVSDAIRRVYHRHLVLIADACHSAGVGGQAGTRALSVNAVNSAFLDRVRGTTGGHVTFTASQVNQLSREDARWGGGHGVFTWYLLEALRGRADEDADGIVTLGEAMEFVRDAVRRETKNAQIPTISQTSFDWYLPMAVADPAVARLESPTADAGAPAARTREGEERAPAPLPAASSRAPPRLGVSVRLDADLQAAGTETLARLLKAQVEAALREAGHAVSDLDVDSASADVLVDVTATLSDQGEVAGMRSAGLELALMARDRGGAVVLASAEGRGTGAGLSPPAAARAAVQRATPQAVAVLLGRLEQAWESQVEDGARLRVLVSGLTGYGQVLWLTDNLGAAVPRSAALVERGADLERGSAELEWFVPLPAPEVARSIQGHPFKEYRVEILGVAPGLIELRISSLP